MIEIEKPKQCTKCGSHSVSYGDYKHSLTKSTVFIYASLKTGSNIFVSKINKIGWICKNCGYYKITFNPERYKKYLMDARIERGGFK